MSILVIENLSQQQVHCEQDQTVLKALQNAHIDWLQACGGKGRCTTCAMYVCKGQENLTFPTAFEEQQSKLTKLRANERLACQCKIIGENVVVVVVPDRLKLPHLSYSM